MTRLEEELKKASEVLDEPIDHLEAELIGYLRGRVAKKMAEEILKP